MNKRIWMCVGVLLVGASKGLCSEPTAASDAALDTIAQINHINWVVNTIKTYNNALVLEEEYDKISPGRLNLNRIPDQETMQRIINMLDQLHALRMKERDLKKWKDDFESRRRERIRNFYIEHGKQATDNVAKALSAGGITSKIGGTALAASRDAISGYVAYSKMIKDIEKEADDHLFELDTEKLNDLHAQNKALLQLETKKFKGKIYGMVTLNDDTFEIADKALNENYVFKYVLFGNKIDLKYGEKTIELKKITK